MSPITTDAPAPAEALATGALLTFRTDSLSEWCGYVIPDGQIQAMSYATGHVRLFDQDDVLGREWLTIWRPGWPAPPPAATADQVSAVLRRYRFRWTDEKDLQEGVHAALAQAGIASEREVRLSARDTIDVLAGPVGIEVKVARPGRAESAEKVTAQLARYASHEHVGELVLVSTTHLHKRVPAVVGGKPVTVVIVGGLR